MSHRKASGLADSPFFNAPVKTVFENKVPQDQKDKVMPSVVSSNQDTATSSVTPSHEDVTEIVRRAVKVSGKEAATHRFTPEEKRALADIIYTYKQQRINTSENELTRIAVNFLIHDFRQNGELSILSQVLKQLNA